MCLLNQFGDPRYVIPVIQYAIRNFRAHVSVYLHYDVSDIVDIFPEIRLLVCRSAQYQWRSVPALHLAL